MLGKIKRISSAELCRQKCSNTKKCRFWTWNSNTNTCTLVKKVKNTGFRVQRDNAVSGSMGEGCNPNKRIQTSNGRKCIGKLSLDADNFF